jgi:hypothetical protein
MAMKAINNLATLRQALQWINEQFDEHGYLEIEIKRTPKTRTMTQNRALHVFCSLLAEALNSAGKERVKNNEPPLDMRHVLKQDVEIPWSMQTVKDFLWRPIQKSITGKDSTTEITTVEPSDIHAVLARHLGEKLQFECPPWPTRDDV